MNSVVWRDFSFNLPQRCIDVHAQAQSKAAEKTVVQVLSEALPVISNHTWTSEDSVAMTPTMWATGSLSMTEKLMGVSSKSSGATSGGSSGLGIHSMCRRQVEDFWGRPLSTALIWGREALGERHQARRRTTPRAAASQWIPRVPRQSREKWSGTFEFSIIYLQSAAR